MRLSSRLRVAGCVALVGVIGWTGRGITSAADPAGKDPIKEAGLTRVGNVLVLGDETAVLGGLKSLRTEKAAADKETKARQLIETQIATKRKLIKDDEKAYDEVQGRLTVVTTATAHNALVLRNNRLVNELKKTTSEVKDLGEQANKVGNNAKNKFVDDLAATGPKAEAVAAKYKELSNDAAVKAAIAKASTATQKVTLGPSPEFTAGLAELKKWQSEVESEAIPMREEHGIHVVDVLLNGQQFPMEVDTGASTISLPGEVAEKLNMTPTDKDPTVQMVLANGAVIEGKQMTLKSVRVGRFTVEDVPCVVLEKGLPRAATLLGVLFLNHFVVKLDNATNELQLTEVKEGGKEGGTAKPGSAAPARGTGSSSDRGSTGDQ